MTSLTHTRRLSPLSPWGSHTMSTRSRTMSLRRCLPVLLAGVVAGLAPAQEPFAQPWNVSFSHVRDAMTFGSFYIEQVRRQRQELPGAEIPGGEVQFSYAGIKERLLHRGADPMVESDVGDFRLEFVDTVGQALQGSEWEAAQRRFRQEAGFTHLHRSFHIVDPDRASQVYDLVFLAHDTRVTQEGSRDVYRMAVIPKDWDRTGWLLELDRTTGYPLFAAEYSVGPGYNFVLESELVVTSFVPNAVLPPVGDPDWWAPTMGVVHTQEAAGAIERVLDEDRPHAVPESLPVGFDLHESVVHTDPYFGAKTAVLTYTDGVDVLFVTQRQEPVVPRRGDDVISFLAKSGMTICSFHHSGVNYQVVGRSNQTQSAVRRVSKELFGRSIQATR